MQGSHEWVKAPDLSRQDIVDFTTELFNQFERLVGIDYIFLHGLRFQDLYEKVLYPEFETEIEEGVDLGIAPNGLPILGEFLPHENRVLISYVLDPLVGDPRRVFTLFHEVVGHAALQGDFLRRTLIDQRVKSSVVTTDESLVSNRRLERQANHCAAHAAAPQIFLDLVMHKHFRLTSLESTFRFIGPGFYDFDDGGVRRNRYIDSYEELCCTIARMIQHKFGGLSVQALSNQVAENRRLLNLVRRKRIYRVAS